MRKNVVRKVFVTDVGASNRATPTLLDTLRLLVHKTLVTLIHRNLFKAFGIQENPASRPSWHPLCSIPMRENK